MPTVCPMKRKYKLVYWLILSLCRTVRSFVSTDIIRASSRFPSQIRTSTLSDHWSPSQPPSEKTIEDLLREYSYDKQLVRIHAKDLPLVAELHEHGQTTLVMLESFVATTRENDDFMEPKALIRYLFASQDQASGDKLQKMVTLGELTTIWHDVEGRETANHLSTEAASIQRQIEAIHGPRLEKALDRLYFGRVGTSRSSTKTITKKQVSSLARQYSSNNPKEVARVESILRQVIKAGVNASRLVSSEVARMHICRGQRGRESLDRAVSSIILSRDAAKGGRFKRFPSIVTSVELAQGKISSLMIVNGGWLVTDQSVRAGEEGRQFAEQYDKAGGDRNTMAAARILRRLECLALGEAFSPESVQLDVKETLKRMDLPFTRRGAAEALVRIGRWSGNEDLSRLSPWSTDIIDAASWFAHWKESLTKSMVLEDGRTDLTSLPCLCIDGRRTAFRDDAIGIRPRKMTGRRVIPEASKWEILVHIVDTSFIYNEKSSNPGPLACLKAAAETRVQSRYDLPRPLHLLPPRALQALSFSSESQCHCCVTLWAYIDERDGRLLDAGLERTVVGTPKQLSYEEALQVMNGHDNEDSKIQSMLLVIERNLASWRRSQVQKNVAVRKREERLLERVAKAEEILKGEKEFILEGDLFQRSRSHELIDSALELYGQTVYYLLKRAHVPIPMAMGADVSRGGRLATAPLRRYIDGVSQGQALAALCNYGKLLSDVECRRAGKHATVVRNAIHNTRARKDAVKTDI